MTHMYAYTAQAFKRDDRTAKSDQSPTPVPSYITPHHVPEVLSRKLQQLSTVGIWAPKALMRH